MTNAAGIAAASAAANNKDIATTIDDVQRDLELLREHEAAKAEAIAQAHRLGARLSLSMKRRHAGPGSP